MPSEMVFKANAMKAARSLVSLVMSFCLASSRTDKTMAFDKRVRSFPAESGLMRRLKSGAPVSSISYQVRDYTNEPSENWGGVSKICGLFLSTYQPCVL